MSTKCDEVRDEITHYTNHRWVFKYRNNSFSCGTETFYRLSHYMMSVFYLKNVSDVIFQLRVPLVFTSY